MEKAKLDLDPEKVVMALCLVEKHLDKFLQMNRVGTKNSGNKVNLLMIYYL